MFSISEKLPSENNREYSYRVLKNAIMSLELYPGQFISEIDLAEKLQISRTPIREVLAKLREEHLVDVIPQVGTYVSKINPRLIEEAAFMRITLEKEILKSSCESFPQEKLIDIKRNIALQEMLLDHNDKVREFHKLDKEFHRLIFQGNNKEHVWESITRIGTHYNRMRLLSEMEHSFDEAIYQHQNIIKVIEYKEIDKVEAIAHEHIIEPIKLWKDLYKEESPFVNYFDHSKKMPEF